MTLDDRLQSDHTKGSYADDFSDREPCQCTAKLAILSDLLEIIGEDERIIDSTSDIHAYFITAKHQLRQELRERVRKYCE